MVHLEVSYTELNTVIVYTCTFIFMSLILVYAPLKIKVSHTHITRTHTHTTHITHQTQVFNKLLSLASSASGSSDMGLWSNLLVSTSAVSTPVVWLVVWLVCPI